MENVYEVSNFLLPEELAIIDELIKNRTIEKEDGVLGRVLYTLPIPQETIRNIQSRVEDLLNKKLDPVGIIFTDYSAKYGQPNLPPHFDGDANNVIVDYQYRSNTSWGLGVDTTVFEMIDNKAIIFNPNEYPHWRPIKTFNDGEYVTMAFFRFPDQSGNTDYSHMRLSQDDKAFDDIHAIRNK
jgi:hypothetical protein